MNSDYHPQRHPPCLKLPHSTAAGRLLFVPHVQETGRQRKVRFGASIWRKTFL
ncbi:hypothetical protein CCHL11_00557 [Colletotrichum chlorophyti]|uniref:Uncharacterized protein n=1 Tax=Colletotrichum chlorophyti TaxID=708187 RepID=A0A1Q8RU63_9PEZI|nr:hypothetical protein CCHL11_00557 [Colletotrichum chlorophyti]